MHHFKKLSTLLLCLLLLLQAESICFLSASAAVVKAVEPTVSVGYQFMVALNSKGEAYAWGDNTSGALGDGSNASRSYAAPVTMPAGKIFTAISAGTDHVMALTADGYIYTWGANNNGQLGYTTQASKQTTPELVAELPYSEQIYAVAVAAGNNYSLALMSNGVVWSWGVNNQQQLGAPSKTNDPLSGINARTTPAAMSNATVSGCFFTDIFAGDTAAAAIASDGKVYLWGENTTAGRLGTTDDAALKSNIQYSPKYLTNESKLVFGDTHTVSLAETGELRFAGDNSKGQFGYTTDFETQSYFPSSGKTLLSKKIVNVAAAGQYSVAVTEDGGVYTWGYNTAGALGTGSTSSKTPQEVTITDQIAVSVSAKNGNAAIVTEDGNVYAWGSNYSGQLGNNSNVDSSTPVAVRVGESESDLLQLGQGPAVITQNAHISVQANIPAPTYTVAIPSTIPVGSLEQTVAKQDQSHLSNTPFQVTVSQVDNLFNEKKVVISLESNDTTGNFVLRDLEKDTYLLPYAVFTAYGNEHEIAPGEVLAEFTATGQVNGYIQIDRSQIFRDGSYSGTVTFSISVEELADEN